MKIAHTRNHDINDVQSIYLHNQNVANIASSVCSIDELKNICYLAGLYHDAGKYRTVFQNYILKSTIDPKSTHHGEAPHSLGGAYLVHNKIPKCNSDIIELTKELIAHAIMSHHGVNDCIGKNGDISYKIRLDKDPIWDEAVIDFYQENAIDEINDKLSQTYKDISREAKLIVNFCKKGSNTLYGSQNFYFGCIERMVLSSLIHGDRLDTMCFEKGLDLPQRLLLPQWDMIQKRFDKYMFSKDNTSRLNQCRFDISQQCFDAAAMASTVFRLVVPTGAGKTLSTLRYALEHARRFEKQHIFYIAPYNSILEQNAKVIRDAINDKEFKDVLEHHCNVVSDDESYLQLTETWDSPIIVTTAVQLLETLFSSKSASIRRFHTLANSIIVMDEVQALPIRCIKLFNLAMNYLSCFAKSSIILCSATLPLFHLLSDKRLLTPVDLVHVRSEYLSAFQRSKIIDDTKLISGGMTYTQASEYVFDRSIRAENMLVIVNTKEAARTIYENISFYYRENMEEKNVILYHLSTNMCPIHRRKTIEKMIGDLKQKRKVICISTNLIEAGVDVSFHYVIRSIAGLDSIIQSAGRCNRSHEYEDGIVSIIDICDEVTRSLKDLEYAQEAMRFCLHKYASNPEMYEYDLCSIQAIEEYYAVYYTNRSDVMEYTISNPDTTILELLSSNRKYLEAMNENERREVILKQAFKTAGDSFKVIPEDGKCDVIVNYDTVSTQLIQRIESKEYYGSNYNQIDYTIAKQLIRALQPYTVGISDTMRYKLGGAIDFNEDLGIFILKTEYYNTKVGVSTVPRPKEFLDY